MELEVTTTAFGSSLPLAASPYRRRPRSRHAGPVSRATLAHPLERRL